MHDKAHRPARAFAFAPLRADRAALGAQRAEMPPERHDALMLCRQVAGACEFRAGSAEGRLLAGDMVLVDAVRGVRLAGDVAATERLMLPRCRMSASAEAVEAAHGRVIPARSAFGVVLGRLLDAVRAPGGPPPEGETPGDAVMRALFSAVAAAAVEGVGEVADDPLLCAIRDHIEANLADPALSPEAIGRHFGLSRAALYRLWRRFGGVAEHIRERRLARARLHLSAARSGHASIAEIAHRCGFRGVSSFSRAYRQRYGCAPNATAAEAVRARTAP